MFFLWEHLKEGSFVPAYCDTDSMCLGLTNADPITPDMTLEQQLRAVFDNIVKDTMRESWESNWKNWFVTENTAEDQRYPGKLKCKKIYLYT